MASADIGDIERSFFSSPIAFSLASFENLVLAMRSSNSEASSWPSPSPPSSRWIAFICSLR